MHQSNETPHNTPSTPDPMFSEQTRNPDVINLLDYLEVIAKNWRMILRTTVIAAIISVVYSLCLPNIYTATSCFLPPQKETGLMGMLMGGVGGAGSGVGGGVAELFGKGTQSDTYVSILNSEAMSDKIIDRFKLMELFEKKYRGDTYRMLDRIVDISAGKKDTIISVSVSNKDPKLAASIANAYVEELGRMLGKLNITGAGENRSYLEERLNLAKTDLIKAEEELKLFQSKNKALDITEQTKGTIKGVADLEGLLAAEEIKLSGLKRVFTDNSQEIKNQLSIISNLKSQISKFEGNRTSSSIPGVGSVPELGQQYVRLMRNFKIQETIVELLSKQYEIARLSEAKVKTSIQVFQVAREPDRKSKPKRSRIVLAATFIAGFGAVLYAFVCEAGERMRPEDRDRWNRIRSSLPNIPGFTSLLRRTKLFS